MPDNPHLNDIGLVNAIQNLIELGARDDVLFEAKQKAEKEFVDNRESMAQIRKQLAAHTGATKRPEIVILKKYAAYIPVPREGYSDSEVYPEIMAPQGLKFLQLKSVIE